MVDVSLGFVGIHGVDDLCVARSANRCDGEDLCFSTLEDSCAVCSWQNSDRGGDWTNFVRFSAVVADAFAEHFFTHVLLDFFVDDVAEFRLFHFFVFDVLCVFFFHESDEFFETVFEFFFRFASDTVDHFFGDGACDSLHCERIVVDEGVFLWCDVQHFQEFELEFAEFFDFFVRHFEGLEHHFFINF